MGYVPDGFTPEQWKKKQEKEKEDQKKKNFAAFGPQSFKSRSLQAFQEDLEKGKAGHLMPVMFAKDRVKKGELKAEDVPYMQRGGSWDNQDVKGAKKRQWSSTDKQYAEKKSGGGGWDWSGAAPRRGGPSTASSKMSSSEEKPKKLWGLF